jgi:hypothetical protein
MSTPLDDDRSDVTDDERVRLFVEAAKSAETEALRRLSEFSRGIERRDLPTGRDPAHPAIRQLMLARAFADDPLGFHGTCEEDGTPLRLVLRPGAGVFVCCTGEPVHCEKFG